MSDLRMGGFPANAPARRGSSSLFGLFLCRTTRPGSRSAAGSHDSSGVVSAPWLLLDSRGAWTVSGHDFQPWQREEPCAVRAPGPGILLPKPRFRVLHLSTAWARRFVG